jgi:hypothetical protein
VSLKFCGISGRSLLKVLIPPQCSHWLGKPSPGAQVAGNEESRASSKLRCSAGCLGRENREGSEMIRLPVAISPTDDTLIS